MADYSLRLAALLRHLEGDLVLAEALLFPEVSRLAPGSASAVRAMRGNARALVRRGANAAAHRRHLPEEPQAGTLAFELEPAKAGPAWSGPLPLSLPYVRWRAGERLVARVPDLELEVVGRTEDELLERLEREARFALKRRGAAASLAALRPFLATERLEVACEVCEVSAPSPLARDRAAEDEDAARKGQLIDEVGRDLTAPGVLLPAAYEVDDALLRAAESLTAARPQSVLLVGPSGVGKTAASLELARQRAALGLGTTPIWSTSGARLVAGMSGFGAWQKRVERLGREAREARAVVCLGGLVELMDCGRSEHVRQGIAGFLKPWIERGELLAIAEATEEALPRIEREEPGLLEAFRVIRMEPPGPEVARRILDRVAAEAPGPPLEPRALDATMRLFDRFATYAARPGPAVRFVRALRAAAPADRALGESEVVSAFARKTGLPRFLLDDHELLDLAEVRERLTAQVIGQPHAVERLVSLLATVKSGLGRPRKPLASLLFAGPTGVGKTELTKALAGVLFGDRGRLVRLDMSEYPDAIAAQRLVGAGAGGDGLLTGPLRDQPFSVVLLDEIEKACGAVFDLLLQVLGEGRLTDARGRVADFTQSVVILTTNLGAEAYRTVGLGFDTADEDAPPADAARAHFVEAARAFFRPELFARLDAVVPFAPLGLDVVRRIAEREVREARALGGLADRPLELTIGPEVLERLARSGFDPRYGARPLKRAVERELLGPLAEALGPYAAHVPLSARAWVEEGRVRVALERTGPRGTPPEALEGEGVVGRVRHLRRLAQRLVRCEAYLDAENDACQLEPLAAKRSKGARLTPEEHVALARLPDLRRALDLADGFAREAEALEERLALAYLSRAAAEDRARDEAALAAASERLEASLLALARLGAPEPDVALLAFYGEPRAALLRLARAYREVLARRDLHAEVFEVVRAAAKPAPSTGDRLDDAFVLEPRFELRPVLRPDEVLATARPGVYGIGLEVRGYAAAAVTAGEDGIHRILRPDEDAASVLVDSGSQVKGYIVPEGIDRRQELAGPPRRVYDEGARTLRDGLLDVERSWASRSLADALESALLACLGWRLQRMLGDG